MSSSIAEGTGAAEVDDAEDDRFFMCKVCRGVVTAAGKASHAKSHKMEEAVGAKKKKAKRSRTTSQLTTEVTLFGPVASSSSSLSELEEDYGPVEPGAGLPEETNAADDGQNIIASSPAVVAVVDEILRNLPNTSGCSSRKKTRSEKSQNVRGQYSSRTPSLAIRARGGRKSRNGYGRPVVETGSSGKRESRGKDNTQKVGGTADPSTTPNSASRTQGRKSKRSTLAATCSIVVPCSDPRASSSRRKVHKVAEGKTNLATASNLSSTQERKRNGLGPVGPGCRIGLIQVLDEYHYPIQLLSVQVKARVLQVIAEVVVTQVYQNKERQPIEAIYCFPTNPEGAVTHFEAEVDGRIVTGKVKANEEAHADFDAAVRNKKSAFLGEEIEPDIFKLRVGYLKPGSKARVTIKYMMEVKNEPGSETIRFYIPTTIAPRYVSPEDEGGDKAEEMARMRFTRNSLVPLSIGVDIFLDGGIEFISSPSHKVAVSTGGVAENPSWSTAFVSLASDTTQMDRDFVLNIRPTDPHRPSLHIAQKEDGWTAAMLHFLPSFKLEEQKSELIFVLDRSGSMEGQSMELARDALRLFLHSMPFDCYFNVIGFGWTFQSLFPASAKYADRTLKQAIKYAKGMKADLGGTELLQPLKKILNKPAVKGYLRQVFVLTDGQVENTERVIGMVQANSRKARVFSLGIGEAASHQLVEGLAKAGGGSAAFVALNERLDAKVLNQLKNALHPSIGAIQLAWDGVEPRESPPVTNKTRTLLGYNKPRKSPSLRSTPLCLDNGNRQSPNQVPQLHDGSQMLVFGLFKSQIPTSVTIRARAPGGPLTLRVNKSPANFIETSDLIHTLAAIKLVRGLELEDDASGGSSNDAIMSQEERQNHKQEIMEIACRNGITSKYTSFVAVDEGDDGRPSSDSWVMMTTRHVPSELALGWSGNGMEEVVPMPPSPSSLPERKAYWRGRNTVRRTVGGGEGYNCSSNPKLDFSRLYAGGGGCPRRHVHKKALRVTETSSGSWSWSALMSSSESESDEEDANREGERVVLRLAKHQSFDGSFSSSKTLARLIGAPVRCFEIRKKSDYWGPKSPHSGILEKGASVTALAILAFETKLASLKPSWELIVRKARYWLFNNTPRDLTISDILHAASDYLENPPTPTAPSSSDDEF